MLPSIYGELKSFLYLYQTSIDSFLKENIPSNACSLAYIYLGHLLNEKPVWKSLACAQEAPQTAIGGLDQLKKSKFEDEDSDEEEHFVDADKQETKETRNKTVSETEKSKGMIKKYFQCLNQIRRVASSRKSKQKQFRRLGPKS